MELKGFKEFDKILDEIKTKAPQATEKIFSVTSRKIKERC